MFRMKYVSAAALAATAIALAPTAAAAQSVEAKTVALDEWSYDDLYASGFSADRFLDADVIGAGGEDIGEVEDLVVRPDGQVTHMIIETSNFLDIGDKHIMYEFAKADIQGIDRVRVDVNEDQIEDYSLFGDVDDQQMAGDKWRISRLLGDYAYLENDRAYGFVEDVVLNRDGAVKAVVVASDVSYGAGGPHAYPYAAGFDPETDRYPMGYRDRDIGDMPDFDRSRMNDWPTVKESG